MPDTSPWIKPARLNIPLIQAADAMKCSKRTAAERLEEAHAALNRASASCLASGQLATPRQADAVAVIQASGAAKQDISRRAWQDVLLGYKKVQAA